jgi:hypothetical protein
MTTIEEIKAELREMIALGDTATAGPWEQGFIRASGNNSYDAAFIARSRTMTPLACKGLLLAIEDLEGRANSYRGDAFQMSAIKRLEEIHQLWEESK